MDVIARTPSSYWSSAWLSDKKRNNSSGRKGTSSLELRGEEKKKENAWNCISLGKDYIELSMGVELINSL